MIFINPLGSSQVNHTVHESKFNKWMNPSFYTGLIWTRWFVSIEACDWFKSAQVLWVSSESSDEPCLNLRFPKRIQNSRSQIKLKAGWWNCLCVLIFRKYHFLGEPRGVYIVWNPSVFAIWLVQTRLGLIDAFIVSACLCYPSNGNNESQLPSSEQGGTS